MHDLTARLALGALLATIAGCTDVDALYAEHEEVCRREARIIVVNEPLWRDYLEGARAGHAALDAAAGQRTRLRTGYVPGYDQRFGDNLTTLRKTDYKRIARDDIVIMRNNAVVARQVDYLAHYDTIAAQETLSCVGLYPELYFNEDGAPRLSSVS